MNVKLSKKFRFRTMLVNSEWDGPVIASYSCSITMYTATDDVVAHNVAYSRIQYWIRNVMQDSIMISKDNQRLNEWQATGARCLIIPDDPVDQLVGIMLFCKLTAMTQDRLIIHEVSLHSDLDDDVVYHHDIDDELGIFEENDWWLNPGPGYESRPHKHRIKDKVIELDRSEEWKDMGLDWHNTKESVNTIVKARFTPNDDE